MHTCSNTNNIFSDIPTVLELAIDISILQEMADVRQAPCKECTAPWIWGFPEVWATGPRNHPFVFFFYWVFFPWNKASINGGTSHFFGKPQKSHLWCLRISWGEHRVLQFGVHFPRTVSWDVEQGWMTVSHDQSLGWSVAIGAYKT